MNVDVIMLSNTSNETMHTMTCRAIDSIRKSEVRHEFTIHLLESNRSIKRREFAYPDVNLVIPNERFRYNRFLNLGLRHCTHDWLVVSNNDVRCTQGWFSTLMRIQQKEPYILSLSPWEPKWHSARDMDSTQEFILGYQAKREVTGWCLVMHRSVIERCQLFDERFEFWYQDDDYAMTLRKHQIKHALVPGSVVHHEVSRSSEGFSWLKNFRMKNLQRARFKRKWRDELGK